MTLFFKKIVKGYSLMTILVYNYKPVVCFEFLQTLARPIFITQQYMIQLHISLPGLEKPFLFKLIFSVFISECLGERGLMYLSLTNIFFVLNCLKHIYNLVAIKSEVRANKENFLAMFTQ